MEEMLCYCRNPAVIKTSWTDRNPGRRFLGCQNYKPSKMRSVEGCGFFEWYDPPLCARSKDIIPGLLRGMRRLEEDNAYIRSREKKLWIAFIVSCILMMMLVGKWKKD